MISRMFIRHYTDNFTNENPFHKLVYILLVFLQLGHILGPVGTFTARHVIALCTICAWHMVFTIPGPCTFTSNDQ